jgi:cytochrome c biogenesis protein CcmG/thiol:disulfide interchange protein DsbE
VKRHALPVLAGLGALALIALLVFGVTRHETDGRLDTALANGKHPAAPATRLPRLDASAGSQSIAAYRGKVVVLNVFASWCTPCADEAPVLQRTQRRLYGKGVTVLGVTWRDNAPDAQAFARKYRLSYPIVRDVSGDFSQTLGLLGVPETFLIDRQGRIVQVRRIPVTEDWVRTVVEPLAARKTA